MGNKIGFNRAGDGKRVSTEVTDTNEVSDGFHTFGELYQHRIILFACLSLASKSGLRCWKSWKHHDGSGFDGWFIGGMQLPTGMVTYHMEAKYWDMFDVEELELGLEWDGHTAEDVLVRLGAWANAGCPLQGSGEVLWAKK